MFAIRHVRPNRTPVMSDAASSPQLDLLSGWKEISAYVGKSERSAQRWEAEIGLPVRRIQTPTGGQIVYASRREIDDWRARRALAVDIPTPAAPAAGDRDTERPMTGPPAAPARRSGPAGVGRLASYCAGVVTGILLCVAVS